MRIGLLCGDVIATLTRRAHRFDHRPVNTPYALDEAGALADAGHEVVLVQCASDDGHTFRVVSPGGKYDVLYCPFHTTLPVGLELNRVTGTPLVMRLVGASSKDVIIPPQTPEDHVLPKGVTATVVHEPVKRVPYNSALAVYLARSRAVCVPSKALMPTVQRWIEQLGGTGRVVFLPHVVTPPSVVEARPKRPRAGVVWIGTLAPFKHLDHILRACDEAGVILTVVAPEDEDAREQVTTAGATWVDGNDDVAKWRALRGARLCACASDEESLWLPGAEALTVGTPILYPCDLEYLTGCYGEGPGVTPYDRAGRDPVEALQQAITSALDKPLTNTKMQKCHETFAALGFTVEGFLQGFDIAVELASRGC